MEAARFMRKPFFVTGYLVTKDNMEAIAKWCEGHVVTDIDDQPFVRVPVNRPTHEMQTKGYVGSWVLLSQKQGKRTYKVYTEEWLRKNFIEMDPEFSDHEIPDEKETEERGRPSRPSPLNVSNRIVNKLPRATGGGPNGAANFLAPSA